MDALAVLQARQGWQCLSPAQVGKVRLAHDGMHKAGSSSLSCWPWPGIRLDTSRQESPRRGLRVEARPGSSPGFAEEGGIDKTNRRDEQTRLDSTHTLLSNWVLLGNWDGLMGKLGNYGSIQTPAAHSPQPRFRTPFSYTSHTHTRSTRGLPYRPEAEETGETRVGEKSGMDSTQ